MGNLSPILLVPLELMLFFPLLHLVKKKDWHRRMVEEVKFVRTERMVTHRRKE
jgi:hypothetical protein